MNPLKRTAKDLINIFIYQGIIFLLFAILIFAYPEIIDYLVAMLFLIAGLECFIYSFRIKRSYKKTESFWKQFDRIEDNKETN